MKSKNKKSEKLPELKELSIKSAGFLDGKFNIILSDGSVLKHITEIISGKPRYEDGTELKITLFIPNETPITEK